MLEILFCVALVVGALAGWPLAIILATALLGTAKALATLHAAVQAHHAARGHDRCWELDAELYRAAGLEPGDEQLPMRAAFREGCRRYEAERYDRPEPSPFLRGRRKPGPPLDWDEVAWMLGFELASRQFVYLASDDAFALVPGSWSMEEA